MGGLTIAAVLLSGYVFIVPGYPAAVDIWPHLVRQTAVADAIRTGHSPFYTFMFYCGFPLLRFYGPVFAFLGALLSLALHVNQLAALKTLLFILHLGSAAAMFFYLRRLTASQRIQPQFGAPCSVFSIQDSAPALLGTLVYSIVPWRVLSLVYDANYPQALIYVLLPLSFLALDALLNRPTLPRAVLLALVICTALVSHTVFAVFLVVFLGVALVFGLYEQPATSQPRIAGLAALSGLLGLLLAGFYIIPFLAEFRQHVFPQLPLNIGTPSLLSLVFPWTKSGPYNYLGAANTLLLAAAVVLLLVHGRSTRCCSLPDSPSFLPTLICLIASLLLVLFSPRFGLTRSLLNYGLPPHRFLVFTVFFATVLIALGWSRVLLSDKPARRWLLLIPATVFVLADCLPHVLNVRFWQPEKLFPVRLEAYRLLSWQQPTRVYDTYTSDDRIDDYARLSCYPAAGFLFGNLPNLLGPPYHQFAPRSMLYAYPWSNLIAVDLGDSSRRELRSETMKAVRLLGISHIISLPCIIATENNYTSVITKPGIAWDDRFLAADRKPPIIFGPTGAGLLLASNRLVPVPAESLFPARTFFFAHDWLTLLQALELDTAGNRMNFIPVTEDQPPDSLPILAPLRLGPTSVEHNRLGIRFEAGSDCFLRLAVSYYPELSVLLDGRPVRFGETKDHFIWLCCPAGEHRLEVLAPLTPIRRTTLVSSALTLLLCLVLLYRPSPRPTRQRSS